MTNRRSMYGGRVQQFQADSELPPKLISTSVQEEEGATYRYGGLVTYEKPITEFPGEILIPVNAAGSITNLRAGNELPTNCVGIRFISLVPGVTISVNGGGSRTVQNGDGFNNCEIQTLMIATDATGTCIVQAVGTGD